MSAKKQTLSNRQAQIVLLAAEGLRYDAIAAHLGISVQFIAWGLAC